MELSTTHSQSLEYKGERDREGPLLKAWGYQAACQAYGLSPLPAICPVSCELLNVLYGFKLFALTNCTANRVFVQMT